LPEHGHQKEEGEAEELVEQQEWGPLVEVDGEDDASQEGEEAMQQWDHPWQQQGVDEQHQDQQYWGEAQHAAWFASAVEEALAEERRRTSEAMEALAEERRRVTEAEDSLLKQLGQERDARAEERRLASASEEALRKELEQRRYEAAEERKQAAMARESLIRTTTETLLQHQEKLKTFEATQEAMSRQHEGMSRKLSGEQEKVREERERHAAERERHAALEVYWRKKSEELLGSMHAADMELIRRETLVKEREESLQSERDTTREEKSRLSEDREDHEAERRDMALRKSFLVEKELKLKDREQHLEEEKRRYASRPLAEVAVQTEEQWPGSSSVSTTAADSDATPVAQKTRGKERGFCFSMLRAATPILVMALVSLCMQLLQTLTEAQCSPCPGVMREPCPVLWDFDLLLAAAAGC